MRSASQYLHGGMRFAWRAAQKDIRTIFSRLAICCKQPGVLPLVRRCFQEVFFGFVMGGNSLDDMAPCFNRCYPMPGTNGRAFASISVGLTRWTPFFSISGPTWWRGRTCLRGALPMRSDSLRRTPCLRPQVCCRQSDDIENARPRRIGRWLASSFVLGPFSMV